MGFGPCSALGAKLAAPDRTVISVCGDGGFIMVPHVLCTAVEYDIPVIWIVWNNFAWARFATFNTAFSVDAKLEQRFMLAATGSHTIPILPRWRNRAASLPLP